MPISMCCPRGPTRQLAAASPPSRRRPAPRRDPRRPTLLMKPPRFVETETSGATVTSRSPTPSTRERSSSVAPERRLRRRRRAVSRRDSVGGTSTRAGGGRDRRGRAARRPLRAALPSGESARERVPLGLRRQPARAARKRVDLLAVEQRRVVLRPAGDLEPVALDRVREDHRRPVGRRARAAASAPRTSREVVAAEVADERARRRPGSRSSSALEPRAVGAVERRRAASRARSPRSAPNSDWYCSFGISSIRRRSSSPPSRANAARSRRPYFSSITCQPLVREVRARAPPRGSPGRRGRATAGSGRRSRGRCRAAASAARRAPPRCCPRRARRRRAAR